MSPVRRGGPRPYVDNRHSEEDEMFHTESIFRRPFVLDPLKEVQSSMSSFMIHRVSPLKRTLDGLKMNINSIEKKF